MIPGENIWGRNGNRGSSQEKERKEEERNEENGVADFGVGQGEPPDSCPSQKQAEP